MEIRLSKGIPFSTPATSSDVGHGRGHCDHDQQSTVGHSTYVGSHRLESHTMGLTPTVLVTQCHTTDHSVILLLIVLHYRSWC